MRLKPLPVDAANKSPEATTRILRRNTNEELSLMDPGVSAAPDAMPASDQFVGPTPRSTLYKRLLAVECEHTRARTL